MKNYVQPGDTITFVPTVAHESGDVVVKGDLIGISCGQYAIGATNAEMKLTGCYRLAKVPADVIAFGASVYWDDTVNQVTTTVGANKLLGQAIEAAAAATTAVVVRLPSSGGGN
jgi:predicted RecA/RadA family phage recombinase